MKRNFAEWLLTFTDSIADYKYYIDFETIYKFFVVYHYPVRKLAYSLTRNTLYLKIYAVVGYVKRAWNALIRVVRGKLSIQNSNLNIVSNIDNIESAVGCFTHEV